MGSNHGRSELMKLNSRALVTYAVNRHGPISRVQLAKLTELSKAHISAVVDELISDGVLVETGSVAGSVGRPKVLLEIERNAAIIGGIWLSDDALEVAIADPSGAILSQTRLLYGEWTESPERAIEIVTESIRCCVSQAGKSLELLKGVGVVVSGLVDPILGTIRVTTNPSVFQGLPIVEMLRDKLGVPVFADTDIRAGALAAQWYSGERESALYMVFSDGVGSAFVNGGELFEGVHGFAPLFAHTVVAPNGLRCHCGRRGCLEAYTSNSAFIWNLSPGIDPTLMSAQEREKSVRQGIAAAAQGDPKAMRAVAEVAMYMGIGVANAVNVFDPAVVYVMGVMIDEAPEMVMDLVRREAIQHVWDLLQGIRIRALPMISEFELRGAIGLVLLRPFNKLREEMNSRIFALQAPAEARATLTTMQV